MSDPNLIDWYDAMPPDPPCPFGGETVTPADVPRLTAQLQAVKAAMSDGAWHDRDDLERATGHNWASVSARLRDLRKVQHGSRTVLRESRGRGHFVYRLVPEGESP